MIIKDYTVKFKESMNNLIAEKFEVIAALGAQKAWEKCPKDTVNLANSINWVTHKSRQSGFVGATNGEQLEAPSYPAARWGTTVEYALRTEFGFSGQDSLGRTYNQRAQPYLRPSLNEIKEDAEKILSIK